MDKLLEIGEIGLLRDVPSELFSLTNDNKLLRQNIDKVKFEKGILVSCLVVLILYIIWREIKTRDEHLDS